MSNQKKITNEEQATLVNLLNKFEPGFLPLEVFSAIIKIIVNPTYLVVPLYEDNGTLKVLLQDRDVDDTFWPGQMALPGKVILSSDESLDAVYQRLIKTELPAAKIKNGPVFCDHIFEKVPRGKEICLINYVLLSEPTNDGKLYDVNNLPKNIVETEIKRVEMAVKKYRGKPTSSIISNRINL